MQWGRWVHNEVVSMRAIWCLAARRALGQQKRSTQKLSGRLLMGCVAMLSEEFLVQLGAARLERRWQVGGIV